MSLFSAGDHWVLVVGGQINSGSTDIVDLVSLDPVNHPVPSCLRTRNPYYTDIEEASGAALTRGNLLGPVWPNLSDPNGLLEGSWVQDASRNF